MNAEPNIVNRKNLSAAYGAVAVAPLPDQEVHRHEHDLEEHEEQEQVEREEHAEAAGFEHEQPRVVRLRVVVRVGAEDGEREQHAREHDEEQRDAVDAERPADAEARDPAVVVDELEAGSALRRTARARRRSARRRRRRRAARPGASSSGRRRGSSATTAAPTNGTTISAVSSGVCELRLDHPTARVRKRPTRMNAPTAMPSA